MDQAVIDRKFIEYYKTLANYGSTGQGWPFPIYWWYMGSYDDTFSQDSPNAFHIGANNAAKRVSNYGALTDDVNDNAGDLILAPFMIVNTKVKGSEKGQLNARRSLAEPLQVVPLTPFQLYFFWRFADVDRPEWFYVEDNRKWPFMRNAGFFNIGYEGTLNHVTVSKNPVTDNGQPHDQGQDQQLDERKKSTTNIILIALGLLAGVIGFGLIFIKK